LGISKGWRLKRLKEHGRKKVVWGKGGRKRLLIRGGDFVGDLKKKGRKIGSG